MIVLGGSRDAYPEEYRVEFVKGLYDACNTFDELVVTTPLTKGGGSVATGGSNEEGYRGVRQNEQQGMHQRTSPTPPSEGGK